MSLYSIILRRLVGARLASAQSGNVAMIFALALPPLAVAAVGGIQLSYVVNARSVSQDVADEAALAGAQQMAVSPVGAADRAVSWANSQLASRRGSSTFHVSALAVGDHSLKVMIDAYTPSFFGDMLPKGGFRSHAEATAQQQALAPLCVLIDGGSSDLLKLTASSRISGACLVHSNGDIQLDPAASIAASRVETAGASIGVQITPAAQTGASSITDPFTSLPISSGGCGGAAVNKGANVTETLSAGLHRGDVTYGNGANITLATGDHYFCGAFTVGNNSTITGTNVSLTFDSAGSFDPGANGSSVSLSGRESGPLAGFVWLMSRNRTASFTMQTDPFTKITGAIYSPNAQLVLTGTKPSAQASDWTVIAAKSLQTNGQANLQINTNYAGSHVTVPIGIGDKASNASPVRIIR